MSVYFESLFKELLSIAYKDTSYNKDNNLSMTAFLTVSTLIEYSSHDKQDKFEEILLFLMNNLDNTLTNTQIDVQKNFDFQCYIVCVIDSIFKKYTRMLSKEVVLRYLTILENTFKMRNGVYDEAILSISSLALSILNFFYKDQKENFDISMNRVLQYLTYSLTKTEETSICRSAVIAIGDISKAIGVKFANYSNEFVPILVKILQENDASKQIKILVINILGDISMNIPEQFFNYLEIIMNLLFSACQLALSISEPVNI